MLSTAATNCECAIERPRPLAGARSEGKSKKVCLALAGRPGAKAKKRGPVRWNEPSSEAAINCDCTLFGPAVDRSLLRTGLSEPGLLTACWPPVHRCVDCDLRRQHDALQ